MSTQPQTQASGAVDPADAGSLASPNQYHLAGDGLTVSYFPDGFGPVGPGGLARLFYQDTVFDGDQIRSVEVGDLGTIISVTLKQTVDVGATTFSLVLPVVMLPNDLHASAPIETNGITTFHRSFITGIGHAQRETYCVTPLRGTAARGPLPL